MLEILKEYEVNGIALALIELQCFFGISQILYITFGGLQQIDYISYYWMMFTIATATWEAGYLDNRNHVNSISRHLIDNKHHVWTNYYTLDNITPKKFAVLFYSEYGAYADREYMSRADIWSALIESTHALLCGSISFMACLSAILYCDTLYKVFISIAMGGQLMNSILYLGEYSIQIKNKDNINYPTKDFPLGAYLIKRPFMYINVFWTIMPIYVSGNVLYGLIY
jgi:hypothetical protein